MAYDQFGYVPERINRPATLPKSRGGTIEGRVLDTEGRPLDAAVGPFKTLEGRDIVGGTDDKGNYRIENLAPGTYLAGPAAFGYGTKDEMITIEAGKVTKKNWQLAPSPELQPWQHEVTRLMQARRSRAKIIEEIAVLHPNTKVGELMRYLTKVGAY